LLLDQRRRAGHPERLTSPWATVLPHLASYSAVVLYAEAVCSAIVRYAAGPRPTSTCVVTQCALLYLYDPKNSVRRDHTHRTRRYQTKSTDPRCQRGCAAPRTHPLSTTSSYVFMWECMLWTTCGCRRGLRERSAAMGPLTNHPLARGRLHVALATFGLSDPQASVPRGIAIKANKRTLLVSHRDILFHIGNRTVLHNE